MIAKLNQYQRLRVTVYFLKNQIRSLSQYKTILKFIIKIISPSNSRVELENKMKESFFDFQIL